MSWSLTPYNGPATDFDHEEQPLSASAPSERQDAQVGAVRRALGELLEPYREEGKHVSISAYGHTAVEEDTSRIVPGGDNVNISVATVTAPDDIPQHEAPTGAEIREEAAVDAADPDVSPTISEQQDAAQAQREQAGRETAQDVQARDPGGDPAVETPPAGPGQPPSPQPSPQPSPTPGGPTP